MRSPRRGGSSRRSGAGPRRAGDPEQGWRSASTRAAAGRRVPDRAVGRARADAARPGAERLPLRTRRRQWSAGLGTYAYRKLGWRRRPSSPTTCRTPGRGARASSPSSARSAAGSSSALDPVGTDSAARLRASPRADGVYLRFCRVSPHGAVRSAGTAPSHQESRRLVSNAATATTGRVLAAGGRGRRRRRRSSR